MYTNRDPPTATTVVNLLDIAAPLERFDALQRKRHATMKAERSDVDWKN